MNWQIVRQFIKYGSVGLVALGVDVGVFTLCRAIHMDLVTSNVIARLAGALTAYTGNFLWTFDQTRKLEEWLRLSWRYAAVWVGATTLSTVLLRLLVDIGFHETMSKLAVEVTMPFINFVVVRAWVFSKKKEL